MTPIDRLAERIEQRILCTSTKNWQAAIRAELADVAEVVEAARDQYNPSEELEAALAKIGATDGE